jgi:hypothetical protein
MEFYDNGAFWSCGAGAGRGISHRAHPALSIDGVAGVIDPVNRTVTVTLISLSITEI